MAETYIDIEAALVDAAGSNVSAAPLPEDFAENLPWALFTRTGGDIVSRVYCTHNVSVDVYDSTWAAAQASASQAVSFLYALEGNIIGYGNPPEAEAAVYTVSCQAPYNNPDPKHPNVPRVTFLATLATRTITL